MILLILVYRSDFTNIGYFLSKISRNFAATFCYFQIPCFHFHITLFKQILKSELRAILEIARTESPCILQKTFPGNSKKKKGNNKQEL